MMPNNVIKADEHAKLCDDVWNDWKSDVILNLKETKARIRGKQQLPQAMRVGG